MIIPIHKPKGPTSHDMVDKLRKITGIKKIGHAGTLDPLASGVLVVGITREGTKQMHDLVKTEKEYVATIKLGETSTTDDAEGTKVPSRRRGLPSAPPSSAPESSEIALVLDRFTGRIQQLPPAYSAVKIQGTPAYKLARQGTDPDIKPREVEIKEIELLEYEWPVLKIRVVTGSGVYIRSLARDIGEALETGAYLEDLERTRVGDFTKEEAYTLEAFETMWEEEGR